MLTKICLKRPVSVFIIVMALIIFGISAIFSAPMELTPDMEMPMLLVMTTYGGAGPEEVEDLVTGEIEDAVSTLSGVKNVTSYSRESVSIVMLELNYGTNMDVAHMDLQEKLNMYKNSLPDDASTPVIIEMSMDMMPVIMFSAEQVGDLDMLTYLNDNIVPEFEKLSGVAQVDVYGGQSNYVSVRLIEERMQQYKLSMNSVISTVAAADFSIPAGNVERGDLDLSLRGGVKYPTAESLKDIPITLSSGQVIHLGDVADIYMAKEDVSSLSRYNGRDNVTISIQKRQSASTVDVTRDAAKVADRINAQNIGIHLTVIDDSSDQIIGAVQSVLSTLALGVILSMLVLFIFFGDIKASLIVGSSMPVSVLASLILMNAMGFSFNVVSLGGLVIGVGMMVDNSIVVLESCYRRRDRQRTFEEAALEGTQIVTSSIIAGTLTTVVVYLPIGLMQGMSGQLFRQLAFTIIFSLSASLFSAMTLVPLLFMRIQPTEKKEMPINRILRKIERVYGSFLKKSFRVKPLVVLASVGLLVASFAMVGSGIIPFELMPATDNGQIAISVDTKPGLKLEETDSLLRDIENMVSQSEDVERYSLTTGGGMMGGGSSATITAYLKESRSKSTYEWVDIWRAQTKGRIGCDISVEASSSTSSMGGGSNVDIPLQGNDYEVLKEASKIVEEAMLASPSIVRVSSSVSSGDPQAEINVDPIRAAAVGFTPQQVVGLVYTMLNGNNPADIRIDGQEYDIRVEYPKDRYRTIEDLSGLILTSPTGKQVPLLDIATLEYSNSAQTIDRKNNQYIVTVTGQPTTAARLTASSEINAALKNVKLPDGVTIGMGQQAESMAEEMGSLLGAIVTAILLVFMVMAMQFESMRFSIIVMICIPFSLIGSFLGLIATGCSISMPAMMGFLTLVGTVINSGILYIDTANQYRASMDAETALISAGRTRLRPILMTTLTTVLAMVPMALGLGDNGEMMQGMAIVIIGGLVASTVLSLLLLPTFYLLFGGRRSKKQKNDNPPLVPPTQPDSDFSVEDLMQS